MDKLNNVFCMVGTGPPAGVYAMAVSPPWEHEISNDWYNCHGKINCVVVRYYIFISILYLRSINDVVGVPPWFMQNNMHVVQGRIANFPFYLPCLPLTSGPRLLSAFLCILLLRRRGQCFGFMHFWVSLPYTLWWCKEKTTVRLHSFIIKVSTTHTTKHSSHST